jgi:hypothetical protein
MGVLDALGLLAGLPAAAAAAAAARGLQQLMYVEPFL